MVLYGSGGNGGDDGNTKNKVYVLKLVETEATVKKPVAKKADSDDDESSSFCSFESSFVISSQF